MKYALHPACAAWPPMSPEEQCDLAADIAANGLREPITLTPDGLLLDGRNRAEACEIADVEPKTVVYPGDPVAFSLSKNKHRRHMSVDQIAMVAATLATQAQGVNQHTSNEASSISKVAKAAGVPKTAVESAKAVLKGGTADEVEAVRSGKAPLRRTANAVRARSATPRRQAQRTIGDIAEELQRRCAGAGWQDIARTALALQCAKSAVRDALALLGDIIKQDSIGGRFRIRDEFELAKDKNANLGGVYYELQEARSQVDALTRKVAELEAELCRKDLEIAALKARLGAEAEQESAPGESLPAGPRLN
jgi:hypothetical protein